MRAFAKASGISTRVLSDLELGRRTNFNNSTKRQLEDTLKWARGGIGDYLSQGIPPTKLSADAATQTAVGKEFVVMQAITDALQTLDRDTRIRVLRWALEREHSSPGTTPPAEETAIGAPA